MTYCLSFQSTVPIRCVRFSRSDPDKAFAFLKAHAFVRNKSNGDSEKQAVFTTGFGASQCAADISEMFNVRWLFDLWYLWTIKIQVLAALEYNTIRAFGKHVQGEYFFKL